MLTGDRLPRIETPRLTLRWLEARDLPALYEIFSDPEVTRYWPWPAHTDPDQARELLEKIHEAFHERRLYQWGVACRGDDRVIGICTLHRMEATHRRAEIGYALGRSHWGRGYIREALSALFDFAFHTLGLHRLEADVDPRNVASVKVIETLGFRREGLLRERWHCQGEIQDAAVFGLLRREWEDRKV